MPSGPPIRSRSSSIFGQSAADTEGTQSSTLELYPIQKQRPWHVGCIRVLGAFFWLVSRAANFSVSQVANFSGRVANFSAVMAAYGLLGVVFLLSSMLFVAWTYMCGTDVQVDSPSTVSAASSSKDLFVHEVSKTMEGDWLW